MKKGFTLIELLAVIIILAVIALIATPIVLDVVDTAKLKAFEESAYGIIETVKLKNYDDVFEGNSNNKTYTFPTDELVFQGERPKGGTVVSLNGEIVLAIHNDKYCATKKFGDEKVTITEDISNCDIKYVNLNGTIKETDPIEAKVQLIKNGKVIYETTSDENGSYSFSSIVSDKYLVLVSRPYKTKYGREVEINNDTNKDFDVLLYAGDFDGNGVVQQNDYDEFMNSGCYGKAIDDNEQCVKYDVTYNGLIDSEDYIAINRTINKFDDIVLNGNSNLSGTILSMQVQSVTTKLANNANNYMGVIDGNGHFTFDNITNGKYRFTVEKIGFLKYEHYILLSDNITGFNVELIAGDLDENGVIDNDDVKILRDGITEITNGAASYDDWKECDFNNDGIIDTNDVEIIKTNIGKTY